MAEDEITDSDKLTDDQKTELDKRLSDHENGLGVTLTWEETIANARQLSKSTGQ